MEKRYSNEGKEIVSQCSWCKDFLDGSLPIYDKETIYEIENKLDQNVAVISHGICVKCSLALYPDMCKDDSGTKQT